jgi:hypothetical protein
MSRNYRATRKALVKRLETTNMIPPLFPKKKMKFNGRLAMERLSPEVREQNLLGWDQSTFCAALLTLLPNPHTLSISTYGYDLARDQHRHTTCSQTRWHYFFSKLEKLKLVNGFIGRWLQLPSL